MRDQLKLLENLQQHDARLQELDGIMKNLPKKLEAARDAIADLERMLERERADLQDTESFWKTQTDEHKEMEAQLSKARSKQGQVRNMKESGAVQRELESTRKILEDREEEVNKLKGAMAAQQGKISEQEAKLQADRQELLQQEAEVQRRLQEVEAQLREARVAREEAARQLKPDALKKYTAILTRRRGPVLVPVRDGTCRGCNMNIPPQLYNTLQRGTTLEMCPNCYRIIYWAKLLEEESAGPVR